METAEEPSESPADAGSETATSILPESAGPGVLYHDATVWIFISAFAGFVLAGSTGGIVPWAGAVIGGVSAYLLAALILASRG